MENSTVHRVVRRRIGDSAYLPQMWIQEEERINFLQKPLIRYHQLAFESLTSNCY